MQTAEIHVSRDMGIDHENFLRILDKAINHRPHQVKANQIHIDDDTRKILIQLGEQQEHRIASICLPRTLVSLTFFCHSQSEVEQFMHRFDIYYHRGGG